MFSLSQEQRDEFLQKKSFALSLFEKNTDTEEILKKIYVESMENKSEKQAEVMARQIIETTDLLFSTNDSFNDGQGSAVEKLKLALEEIAPEKKAEVLLGASYVFENIETLAKKGTIRSYPLEKEFNQLEKDGFNEASINALLERAVAAASSEKTAEVLLKAFEKQTDEQILGRAMIDAEGGAKAMAAIDSMIIYTMSVNGNIEGVDPETSVYQITAGVCLDTVLQNIAASEKNGGFIYKVKINTVCSVLLSLLIIAAVTAVFTAFSLAAGFTGNVAFITGALCVSFCSAILIKKSLDIFHNTRIYAKLDVPLVAFPEIALDARDRIRDKINSAAQAEEKEDYFEVNYNADYSWLYNDYGDKLYVSPFDENPI